MLIQAPFGSLNVTSGVAFLVRVLSSRTPLPSPRSPVRRMFVGVINSQGLCSCHPSPVKRKLDPLITSLKSYRKARWISNITTYH